MIRYLKSRQLLEFLPSLFDYLIGYTSFTAPNDYGAAMKASCMCESTLLVRVMIGIVASQ
jgi:hypothetical protein